MSTEQPNPTPTPAPTMRLVAVGDFRIEWNMYMWDQGHKAPGRVFGPDSQVPLFTIMHVSYLPGKPGEWVALIPVGRFRIVSLDMPPEADRDDLFMRALLTYRELGHGKELKW